MRLFLAIYPSKEYLDYVRDVMRKLDKQKRNLRPVTLDQVHLTVRFIGANVSEGSKQKIAKEFLKLSGNLPKPMIEIGELSLGFPRQHYPSILFSDVANNSELHELVDTSHRTIRGLKLGDTIQWKSHQAHDHHITLARLKPAAVNKSTIRTVKQLISEINVPLPPAFQATEMYLVSSKVTRARPVYQKLEKIRL